MRIEPHIMGRHWEAAAAEQMEERLRAQGYEVERDARFDDLRADLVARRGDEVVVYAFKAPREDGQKWARRVARLRERAVAQGARFRLVFVRPPRENQVEIENIDAILEQALSARMPDELRALSGNAGVRDVFDVVIGRVGVRPHEVEVSGDATVALDFEVAEEEVCNEHFPFSFEIVIDGDGRLAEVLALQVDVSSWLGTVEPSQGKKRRTATRPKA